MTRAELQELLGATLHGPLPVETVQRLMATAHAAMEALEVIDEIGRELDVSGGEWDDVEAPFLHWHRMHCLPVLFGSGA